MKAALTSLTVSVALLATPVLADRPPTLEKRDTIQSVLIAEGFTSWSEIEWDEDGYWEVDDAIAANGQQYDLKLDAEFQIIHRGRN